jgi:hypothetical protein
MGGCVLVILVLGSHPAHPAPEAHLDPEGGRGSLTDGRQVGQVGSLVPEPRTTLYGARKYIAL